MPKREWEYLLFSLDCCTLSVVLSAVPVSGEKSVRLWTNLVVEYRLLDIFEKPE